MDSILIQKKVTENVQQVQDFMKDLVSWEKDMKRKEQELLQEKHATEELPPIRKKLCQPNKSEIIEERTETVHMDDEKMTEQQKREKSLFEKERGNELVKQSKWVEAIHHYTQAIESYFGDATFYANRALCYLNIKKWQEAIKDCTVALQIDPSYVKAYHRRAMGLKELNQYLEALDDLFKARQLDPDNVRLAADFTMINKLLSEEMKSKSKYVPPKESNKDTAYAIKEEGNVFVKKKNWNAAIECYTAACRLFAEDPSFYANRALCYLKLNEPKRAILDCIRALELDPTNTKVMYRKALANKALGDYSRAHDDLLTAFKLEPFDKSIQQELNNIEKELGMSEVPPNSIAQATGDNIETKRIAGEKFLELGGEFIKPLKKPPHLLSKVPLKTIEICEKTEKDILQNAIDEMTQKELSLKSADEKSKIINIPIDVDVKSLPIPRTSMQFVSNWNKLIASPILQYHYLKRINGKEFPSIFKDALETDLFSQILEILTLQFIKINDSVYDYLYGLSNVRRFSALLLFASEEDKENIRLLIDHCKNSGVSAKDVSDLETRFCL